MNVLLKLHKEKPIEIYIPTNTNEKLLVTIDDVEETSKNTLILHLKTKNMESFPFLTKNIIYFYTKSHLRSHLKLFSIDKDIELRFI